MAGVGTQTAVTILTNPSVARRWQQHLSPSCQRGSCGSSLARESQCAWAPQVGCKQNWPMWAAQCKIAAITGHRTLAMVQEYTRSADQERLAGAAVVKLAGLTTIENRHYTRGGRPRRA